MSCLSVRNTVISWVSCFNQSTVYTDDVALKWLQRTKESTDRLARWSMKQAYHFTIHHKPRVTNQLTPEIMAFMKTLPCTLKWNFFMTILQQCLALPAFLLQISLKFSQLIPLQEKQVMWTVFYLSIQAFFESLPCQTYPNYKKNAMTTNQ